MRGLIILFLIAASTRLTAAPSPSIVGDWQEPTGSVIRIEACGDTLCMRIVALGPQAPLTDIHNPDRAQRAVPLCGLVIGSRFHLTDGSHAIGGALYDPKSGNTYRGTMTLEAGSLKLRGYVGIPLFGKSEVWHRPPGGFTQCRIHH